MSLFDGFDPAFPPSFGDIVRARAIETGDRTAIEFEGGKTSYRELHRRANRIANALIADGIGRGDRVAVLARNCDGFFFLLIGAALADVTLVPINWRLSATEIAYLLEDSGARILFVDEANLALAELSTRDAGGGIELLILDRARGEGAFGAWLEDASDDDPGLDVSPKDAVLQLYTSGTTGKPKGAMLSHHSLNGVRLSQPAHVEWAAWTPEDVCLISMPLFHIGGIGTALASLYFGAKMIILRDFEPDAVLDHIERDGIKKLFLVPAAFRIMLDHPRTGTADFSSLQYILYGSSPITTTLLEEAIAVFGCGFVQTYGMTETSGTIVALPPEDHRADKPHLRRAAGKPLAGVEIAIFGPGGDRLGSDLVGEVGIRSEAAMIRYWHRPNESAEAFTADGFLLSGDAGYVDGDGYLFICDRIKDMIISGGENVYAAEVESAVVEHPAVAEAAVIGVPDKRWGEAVHAVVVLKPGQTLDEEKFRSWCRDRLAGFKTPRSVAIADSLPRNAAGKILRRELRAQALAGSPATD